jgi:transcriptional regulator with XRE-family HTH domain
MVMARTVLALAEKLVLLFEYGQSRGLSTKYRAIAVAIGENTNNIRKIYLGQNANPGLKILTGLVGYFGIDLAYFNCSTKADCQTYLAHAAPARETVAINRRAQGISEDSLALIRQLMDIIRKAEGLPPL